MTRDILDSGFSEQKFELRKGEEILWEGSPRKYFSVTLLEIFGKYESISYFTAFQIIVLLNAFIQVKALHSMGKIPWAILYAVVGIFVALLPDILKNHRKWHTAYFLTNKRVIIQTRKWTRKKVYELPLVEIGRISYQEFRNGVGVIYFMPKERVHFRTRDFVAAQIRSYPTFELIDNVVEECTKIQKHVAGYNS